MTNPFTRSLFGPMFCDEKIASQFSAPNFTARMLAFEKAWTHGLRATNAISFNIASAATSRIESFANVDFGQGSSRDGLPVPQMVAELRDGLPSEIASAIHTGATSQDVIDTAMILTIIAVHEDLVSRLQFVQKELGALVQKFGSHSILARTRMQAALPTTAKLRLNAWQRALDGHLHRASSVKSEISFIQVGGAIGDRDIPNAKAMVEYVAKALDLKVGNVWHTDRSFMVSYGNWLCLLAGTLAKIAQDIVLMSQQGIEEITLESGGRSSAMPHKANPVAAEAMVALGRYVAAQQSLLAQAMVHEQERSGTAWALEWLTLPVMLEATGASLAHAPLLFGQIKSVGQC